VNTTRGRFITFEGGEGAGKSTQVRRLADRLRSLGHEVVTTREPGGSPRAEAIREILLSGRARPLGALGEAYLFSAARIDHVAEVIEPALQRGAIVLCDRFADSMRAYQGAADGLPVETIDELERAAVGDTRPDLTVLLDIAVVQGLARVTARLGQENGDRFETDTIALHEARRRAFLAIAERHPERCVVVDGGRAADAVADDVWDVVTRRLALMAGDPGHGR
jgi:dTMP kinase